MSIDKNQISIGKYTIKFAEDTSRRGKALTIFSWCLFAQVLISLLISVYYLLDKLF